MTAMEPRDFIIPVSLSLSHLEIPRIPRRRKRTLPRRPASTISRDYERSHYSRRTTGILASQLTLPDYNRDIEHLTAFPRVRPSYVCTYVVRLYVCSTQRLRSGHAFGAVGEVTCSDAAVFKRTNVTNRDNYYTRCVPDLPNHRFRVDS